MRKNHIILAVIVVLSGVIYSWAITQLDRDFDFGLIALLLAPSLLYLWFYRNEKHTEPLKHRKTPVFLLLYGLFYFTSIFFINILGSSVAYWLVQFLLPIAILKICKEQLSGVFFKWTAVFSDVKFVIISAVIIIPFLVFGVRDSEQIIVLCQSWKIIVYLPLSILYMLVIVAFWEEFFFRGIILNSILKLSNNASVSIFISALLFGTYHIPMRYLNVNSEYYGDLLSSIASTINE